jgi:hypothetical protein
MAYLQPETYDLRVDAGRFFVLVDWDIIGHAYYRAHVEHK